MNRSGEFASEYILTIIPFVMVGWLSRKVYLQTRNLGFAWGLFLVAVAVLGVNCAWGYHTYELIAREKKWTAAAFAIVRMVVVGFVVAGIFWVIAGRLIQRVQNNDSRPR